jgi:serine/threonine protein kinase
MPDAENYQHYQVLRREDGSLWELGRGAMGITYKAFDTNLRCTVALKVINNTYLDSEVARQRFLREARAAAALRHQNVASVFHLGSDHDSYFYAMEYIDGETVDAHMAAKGPMEPVEALGICLQVTRALAAAARQQLVHRDLKPANLMLVDEDGEKIVKVIDFGLAKTPKREGEDSGTLTIAGGFVGTPHFASPEQLEERDIDIRSDIYSLGATLYYMLTGRPPYSGSVAQIMSQHLYKPIPTEPLANTPACVTTLIEKMMQKDREKRPQTPAELRREIVSCLEQLQGAGGTTVQLEPEAVSILPEPPKKTAVPDVEPIPDEPLTREAVLGRRYQLIRELNEVPQGRQFLAYDLRQSRQVTLLIFNTGFLADKVRFTSMEEEVNRLHAASHTSLRQVYSLESTAHHSFLVQEWIVGPTLLEILRARSALTGPEVVKLLEQLAPLSDHATQKNLQTVDLTLSGVQLTYPGLIQAAISTQFLQKPLPGWPGLVVKVAALDFSSSGPGADQATWAGSATLIHGTGAANGPRGSYLRLLTLLAYELLGGQRSVVETTGRISPIATLTEGGNVVLRRGITDDYPGSSAMLAELRSIVGGAEPTVAPVEPLVREPPPDQDPELVPGSVGGPGAKPETIHRVVSANDVSTPKPVSPNPIVPDQTSMPPPLPPADSRPGEMPVPNLPATDSRRPRVSMTGVLVVAVVVFILVAILALGGFLVWKFTEKSATNTTPTPFAQITPKPTSTTLKTPSPKPTATSLATPTPQPTATAVTSLTPKSSAIVENTSTPMPTPTVSATPVETREAALQRQLDSTAERIKNGDWYSGMKQYIQFSNQYPDSKVPRDKLENLIAEVRSSRKIGSANVQEYQSDLEQAADLGSIQAMLLLGESTRQTNQEYALRWFEAAAAKGNDHAKVQAGLVLSNRRGDGDAVRAFEYFKSAADNGNGEGKFTAGECYYLGKGTTVDVPKALELLQEAAAMHEPRAMDLLGTHFRRAKDYQKAKTYFEEATQLGFVRSTVNLGVLYLQGEGVTQNYQTAAVLFKKGAERSDSYGMFFYAECLAEGKGVQKDAGSATEWAKKAAQAGNPLAIQWCKAKNINYQ